MQINNIKNSLLLKNCKVVDPFQDSIYDTDILIKKGRIEKIDKNIPEKGIEKIVDLNGLSLSPGFIDIHVHFREPGNEDAETIESGAKAAIAGGFTQVCCMPNTNPAIDTRGTVQFIYEQAENLPVKVYPIAAITKGRKGKELTEMGELSKAGAVAFSDDGSPVMNSQLFRNALEYSKLFNKPIINHAEDNTLKGNSIMNEGVVSTQLGLSAAPAIAEEIMISRDLEIAGFTKARIHIPHVSTAGSVDLIRKAKKKGVNVTAEATPHHFSLTDEYLRNFDANGKVSPPLRTEKDRLAIIEGIKDGTIDAIATDHAPHNYETKETSIDLASFGMIGLESAFGLAMTKLVQPNHINLMKLIKSLTVNPAAIMNLELSKIAKNEIANFTIFNPDEWWVFSKKDIYSRSGNTPFIGEELTGRVKSVITGSKHIII